MNQDINDSGFEKLIAAAAEARLAAYAPYSRYRVGAALEDTDGRIFTGCNIENVSSGATCCAERTAVGKAISEGSRKIRRVAVVSDEDKPCLPCGICRQVLAEFAAPDFILLAGTPIGRYKILKLDELLPNAFSRKADPAE
jgi:cytidine deaminase